MSDPSLFWIRALAECLCKPMCLIKPVEYAPLYLLIASRLEGNGQQLLLLSSLLCNTGITIAQTVHAHQQTSPHRQQQECAHGGKYSASDIWLRRRPQVLFAGWQLVVLEALGKLEASQKWASATAKMHSISKATITTITGFDQQIRADLLLCLLIRQCRHDHHVITMLPVHRCRD